MDSSRLCVIALLLLAVLQLPAQDSKKPGDKEKAKAALNEIAGSAEFLRGIPKRFGYVQKFDSAKNSVTILFDGDKEATTWPLAPDVEIKKNGWWGRLDQIGPGSRAWAWFKVDRAKKPVAIFMLADDLSEQDIHGDGVTVKAINDKTIVFTAPKDRTIEIGRSEFQGSEAEKFAMKALRLKDQVFIRRNAAATTYQTDIMSRATFEEHRERQKKHLREIWLKEGLPGAIGFLHVYAGEVDVILDHEAMRWARSLKLGDKVALAATPAINAVVKSVTAQREKTQVRLVVKSFDLADLSMGQRVKLKMPAPAAEIENAVVPPGIDGPKTKEERIDWFLANTYCTCKVGGDGCTGHFYTLASCNPNACAAPNQTRKYIAKKIDDGWTNREIFDAMLKERGPIMLRPHLLP